MSMTADFETDTDEREDGVETDDLTDDDLDDDLEDDEDQEPTVSPQAAVADPGTPSAPAVVRSADASKTKAFARRVAAKTMQLAGAAPEDLTVLSALMGTSGDVVDLAVAVMTGDRTALTVAGDVERIAAADPFSAAATAQETGRPRMKAIAALLHALGETASANLNGSDAKAGIAVAQGVHRLSKAARERLERASALARRTV